MNDYKLGDCLLDRRLKKVAEIIEIIEFSDGDNHIVIKYFDTPYPTFRTLLTSKINKLYVKSKAARLLHKK